VVENISNGSPPLSADDDKLSTEEIRILRTLAATRRVWWKDYSLLIAGLAFVLSLLTTLISAYVAHQKDMHDEQTQLSSITQTMQDNAIKQADLAIKYQGDVLYSVQSMLNNEYYTLQKNAVALALRLGANATTGELVVLSNGVGNAGDLGTALKLLNLAVDAASNPIEESYALRTLGSVQIRLGKSANMRKDGDANFQAALELDKKYGNSTLLPGTISYLKISAELGWSVALTQFQISCEKAAFHYDNAQRYLDLVPEAERQYVLTLLVGGDGAIVENGKIRRPAGCPAPSGTLTPGNASIGVGSDLLRRDDSAVGVKPVGVSR
jgi:hypothetical protein